MKANFSSVCSKMKLKDIREFVADQIGTLPLSPTEKNQVILAIDEACANAIIHGNNCDENKEILIEMETSGNELVIDISDIGRTDIDLTPLTENDVRVLIKERKKGGLGLKLIHSIMDTVQFDQRNGRYFCTLTKSLA